ncbi:hypothetical protein RUM44_003291 [Polyplax serrata]|uniref:CWH43-like N-terminal domain-containing protein n=1 Tax=Polyplax serrata TaxID=468196 RepID=A0ABR1AG36_POLSC
MVVTFTLAVTSEHVYPVMPFMSYTGDRPVESCIFSFGLNSIAATYIIICYLRYQQIIKICEEDSPSHPNSILRMNRKSLWWGISSAAGLSVTGSFQELHVASVHRLGALICTYCGFIYFWYQTVLSDLMIGKLNSRKMSYLRTSLSLASTMIHVVAPILVTILDTVYPRHHEETLLWSINEAGWHLHVCCSFLEWTIFFINVTYLASFYKEFKLIKINKDEITFTRQEELTQRPGTENGVHRKSK